MSIAVGLACAYLGIVGIFGRLNYTVPTTVDMLRSIVNSNLWTAGFLVVAGFVWAAIATNRLQHQAMQLAFAVIAPWGVFNLLWGLSSERPVSLAAPGLALVVAVIAQALALAWASDADRSSITTGR